MVLGDLEVHAVAVLGHYADIAGVERARNIKGHAHLLSLGKEFGAPDSRNRPTRNLGSPTARR
jgi:hypothetical protein